MVVRLPFFLRTVSLVPSEALSCFLPNLSCVIRRFVVPKPCIPVDSSRITGVVSFFYGRVHPVEMSPTRKLAVPKLSSEVAKNRMTPLNLLPLPVKPIKR
jgi:hypothetical protein